MSTSDVQFLPVGSLPDNRLTYAMSFARHEGQWLFGRHKLRTTWEHPGGHIEPGESAIAAAHRELREESGATDYTLTPLCIIAASGAAGSKYGLLCFAEIHALGPLDPAIEIAEVRYFPAMPENITYPLLMKPMYDYVQGWLNTQSAPDELWDVYDANRLKTGRTHRRGDPLALGDYHLVVHVFIRRPTGEFLITQRDAKKGFPLLWECTGGSASAGENSLTAALREVQEETGLCVLPEHAQLVMQSERQPDCLRDIYLITHDFELSDVKLLPGETVDKQLVSKEDMLVMWEEGTFVPYDYLGEFLEKIG